MFNWLDGYCYCYVQLCQAEGFLTDRQTDICNSRVAFTTEKVHCNTYNELTEYLQSKNGHDLNIFKPQSNTNYLKYFVRRFVAKNCMF